MLPVGLIVLRVDDLQRQTEFWEAALDYVRREGDSDDFVPLHPRDGIGPNLSLDRIRSTLQIPPLVHLDLYTDDQTGEVERLFALGATEVYWDVRQYAAVRSCVREGWLSACGRPSLGLHQVRHCLR